ncbi:MAG: YdiU family protein [Gammaproteobacteria bacterium]|nr:YdiU family protein [Gammaproteobacteria bacterium]
MTTSARRALQETQFESTVVEALPADPQSENVPRQVSGAAYTVVAPTAVVAPSLLAWSEDLAERLGLERPPSKGAAVDILAGNGLAPGMCPYAARYGGYQFGNWAGQLGDGRAITLGELIALDGSRQELQLKGAGPTPYSRFADGRAVLRSSLREFLCSEAMHHLGVPTTRALALVSTGEQVVRDMFYDGHPKPEPGAIVCRVAPTFIRFGNFEIHAASKEHVVLRRLVDHVICAHYSNFDIKDPATPAAWFTEICRRTAVMIAHWMRVGFVHGVMNTDNMSIVGLTLDYGPYGWLEGYDPNWTPNTTDAAGRRYCYGKQPQIGLWNLARLAGALMPIIEDCAVLQRGLELYRNTYRVTWQGMLAGKIGLDSIEREGDTALVDELFSLMAAVETDMPIFFRALGEHIVDREYRLIEQVVEPALYDASRFPADLRARWQAWFLRWQKRGEASGLDTSERQRHMNANNPCYLPRNYLAQLAIDAAAEGNVEPLAELLSVLRRPYERQLNRDAYASRRPEWARHRAGCSALSCSS